jgi:hypothetical protein
MGFTNYPHGITSFGSPVTGPRFSSPWATHYFVDGDGGSDSNAGTDPNSAKKTIQSAVTASTGGDVIYIKPKTYTIGTGFARYSEDVSVTLGGSGGSTGVTATNANKSLIGVTPRTKPTDFLGVRWTFASATQLTVDAPCLHVENIGFFSEAATYTMNFRNNGTTYTQMGTFGFSVYNCEIKGDGKLYANGADGSQIINCRFQSKYDGTTGGIHLSGSANQVKRATIQGCEFIGGNSYNMATAPVNTDAPCWDLIIRDCYFSIITDSGLYIVINGTSNTGIVANCYFGAADINARCTGLVAGTSGVFSSALYDQTGIDDFAT